MNALWEMCDVRYRFMPYPYQHAEAWRPPFIGVLVNRQIEWLY